MNMKALNRKAIEGYLRQYKKMKEDLKELEEEIAESNMVSSTDLRDPNAIGDPTAKKALFITSFTELNYMRRVVSAIEAAKKRMKQRLLFICEEYYSKDSHYLVVCEEAHIEKSMFYNCLKEIVTMVAEELKMPV